MRGALVRPSRRETAFLSFTRTRVGTTSTLKRSASSGFASTSTRRTRRRWRSLRSRCASRLSIRRAGPERSDQKNTSSGLSASFTLENLLLSERSYGSAVVCPEDATSKLAWFRMGDWYTIGLALGLGIAFGTLFAGVLSSTPLGRAAAVLLAS